MLRFCRQAEWIDQSSDTRFKILDSTRILNQTVMLKWDIGNIFYRYPEAYTAERCSDNEMN